MFLISILVQTLLVDYLVLYTRKLTLLNVLLLGTIHELWVSGAGGKLGGASKKFFEKEGGLPKLFHLKREGLEKN